MRDLAIPALFLAVTGIASSAFAGDAMRGEILYVRCQGCHAIDANRVGPLHRGIVGRKAGSAPGYVYSPALAGAGLVWDEATLDRWLADPASVVPGTRMGYRLADPMDRADIIAFLKTQR